MGSIKREPAKQDGGDAAKEGVMEALLGEPWEPGLLQLTWEDLALAARAHLPALPHHALLHPPPAPPSSSAPTSSPSAFGSIKREPEQQGAEDAFKRRRLDRRPSYRYRAKPV